MDKIEEIEFSEFKKDATGAVLRYLILIHDCRVLAVLYNTGNSIESLRYAEYRLDTDKLQTMPDPYRPSKQVVGRVTHVPIRMLSSESKAHLGDIVNLNIKNEPIAHCDERSFAKLPGYVDFEIYSNDSLESLLEAPMSVATVVCKLSEATS